MEIFLITLYVIWSFLCALHWYQGGFDTKPLPQPIFNWVLLHTIVAVTFLLSKILQI